MSAATAMAPRVVIVVNTDPQPSLLSIDLSSRSFAYTCELTLPSGKLVRSTCFVKADTKRLPLLRIMMKRATSFHSVATAS